MQDERRERRRTRALVVFAALAVLLLVASLVPSPYVIERPGPVLNTLGTTENDGEESPVIAIDGADVYETDGELNLLTVSIVGSREHPLGWLALVPALIDRTQRIAPVEEFYPEGLSEDQRTEINDSLMDGSQFQAAAAAFRELGEPVKITLSVEAVGEGTPAEGVLEEGDLLLAVDGSALTDYADLRDRIADDGAGKELSITIERDGEEQEVRISPAPVEGEDTPQIGVAIGQEFDLPAVVDISLSDIGGPSAGLAFSLAIYDRLTPGALLDGSVVSATGTIDDAGEVGEIGGLEQKIWGAANAGSDLFLMPLENCGSLPEELPEGMSIAPVATLNEAIAAIEANAAGETPSGIERCDTAAAQSE